MKAIEFIEKIAESIFMEGEQLMPETELNELVGWDSVGRLGIIAMIDDIFNKRIEAKALRDCETVQDIVNLVKEELEN